MENSGDVNGGKRHRVGDLVLGDGPFECVVRTPSRSLQSGIDLAKKMSNALIGGAPANIDQPFPRDCSVCNRLLPKSTSDCRMVCSEFSEDLVGNDGNRGVGQRAHAVIHPTCHVPGKISEIAGNLEADDPASLLRQNLVLTSQPFKNDTALLRTLAFKYDVLIGFVGPGALQDRIGEHSL